MAAKPHELLAEKANALISVLTDMFGRKVARVQALADAQTSTAE